MTHRNESDRTEQLNGHSERGRRSIYEISSINAKRRTVISINIEQFTNSQSSLRPCSPPTDALPVECQRKSPRSVEETTYPYNRIIRQRRTKPLLRPVVEVPRLIPSPKPPSPLRLAPVNSNNSNEPFQRILSLPSFRPNYLSSENGKRGIA